MKRKFILLYVILLLLTACVDKKEDVKKSDVDSNSLIQERLDEAKNRDSSDESNVEKNDNKTVKVTEKVDVDVKEDVTVDTSITTKTTTKTKEDNKSNNNESKVDNNSNNNKFTEGNKSTDNKVSKNNFVSYNGKLKVSGTNLVNQYGEKIQLRGVSSHGIQWFGNLVTNENLDILKNNWGSNVFRIAMYTDEGGYISNKGLLSVVEEKMQMVINHDMYVIVDWHILHDGNPNTYINESKSFFEYMSKKYANVPNVIFEICNEPNGGVNWNNHIKPYADQVTSVIRKYSDAIVLVGTGTWSQDILDPVNNRLNYSNVMYDVHFYSGTHTDWLRNRVNEAYSKGLPIFISEWGTSDASGNGGVYLDEAQKWINFLNNKNISFINWSLANKNESSALLKSGCNTLTDSCLTTSGTFVKKVIKG